MNITKALLLSISIHDESKIIYKKYHDNSHNINNPYSKVDSEIIEYEEIINESYIKMQRSLLPEFNPLFTHSKHIQVINTIKNKSISVPIGSNFMFKWKHLRSYINFLNKPDYSALYYQAYSKLNKQNETDEPINYPNLFLRSYEKNIIRMIFFLIKDGIIFNLISDCTMLFSRKLDADIRSAYFYKLKQWMNFEIQKKQKQTSSARIKNIHRSPLYNIYYKNQNQNISFIEELEFWKIYSIENLHEDFLQKDLKNSVHQRTNPLYLSTHFIIISLFSLLSNFREYFNSSQRSNREFFYLKTKKSSYFEYLQDQIYCDLLTILKMMQINESWLSYINELNRRILSEIQEFILEWKTSKNSINLLTRNTPKSNKALSQFASLLKETYSNPHEDSSIYIAWLHKNIQSAMIETFFKQAGRKYFNHDYLTREKNISVIDNYYPIVILNEHVQLDTTRSLFLNLVEYFVLGRKYSFQQMEQLSNILRIIKTKIAYDHIRLVMSIAKNLRYSNVEVSDLLQEGMIGLIKAVERFQLDRGYQFSTYATWWVHQGLNRVIATQSGSMIPIPTHLQRKVHLIQSTSRDLSKKLKREPLIDEIARELRIPVYKIYQFLEASSLSKRLISLDQKVASEDNRTFQYFLKTVTKRMPVNTTRLFSYIIRFLPPKDSTILKMRLGIIPYKRHTMEQVARIFSVNRDKIKMTERNSLGEIKYNLSLHGRYEQIAPILSTHLSEKILYGHLYHDY